MQLRQFLNLNDLTQQDFAESIGASKHAVGKWVRGERTPRKRQLAKIAERTNGAVTPNDFLSIGASEWEQD